MTIMKLILIYVVAQKVSNSMEKIIKKEDIELSLIEEMIIGIVMLISSVVSLIVLIAFPIILFF